ncbi:MAG: SpoIID/LytB domain-containing protein [Vulcanococcus sp.]|jgi:stage II sporulation protein D
MRRHLPAFSALALALAMPLPVAAEVRVLARQQEPWLRILLLEAPNVRIRPSEQAQGMRVLDAQGLQLGLEPPGSQLALDATSQQRELWLEAVPAPNGEDPGLWLGSRRFRGRLQLRPLGNQLQVVNHVPLETYLPSVVGSEMPASWPEAALKAQAVAARTYALKARKPASPYDVKATVASQVYKGVEAETPSTWGAVNATRGMVLTFGNALIDAVFHSSSGGATESSGDLWSRQLPYLVSVPDFDQASPVHLWRQPLDQALLQRAFPELDRVLAIKVVATTPSGRVRQARVVGSASELLLSGAQLRSRLGLRSTWVRFELEPRLLSALPSHGQLGWPAAPPPLPAFSLPPAQDISAEVVQLVAVGRGYGHGIGMSQWGALAMAQRGESYEQILRHYYRGAQLQPYGALAQTPAPRPGSGQDALQALAPSP